MKTDTRERYGSISRMFHWSMGLLPITGISIMVGNGYGLSFFGLELVAGGVAAGRHGRRTRRHGAVASVRAQGWRVEPDDLSRKTLATLDPQAFKQADGCSRGRRKVSTLAREDAKFAHHRRVDHRQLFHARPQHLQAEVTPAHQAKQLGVADEAWPKQQVIGHNLHSRCRSQADPSLSQRSGSIGRSDKSRTHSRCQKEVDGSWVKRRTPSAVSSSQTSWPCSSSCNS